MELDDEARRWGWALLGLARAVARLAMPADDQREYLRAAGVGRLADELALEFDDFVRMVGPLEEAGWIGPEQAALVRRIDGLLALMSGDGNAALWELAALEVAPEWGEVRALAKKFVFGLGT